MSDLHSDELWEGPDYGKDTLRILVLGWSRFDEEYSDRKIINEKIIGTRHKTFTKFVQAVLGKHHSDPLYDAVGFWNKVIFCNYERGFFPGGPRIPPNKTLDYVQKNQAALRAVIEKYQPTHCIVWGKANWSSIVSILQEEAGYHSITVDEHKTFFSHITHPSYTYFRSEDWSSGLSEFLSIAIKRNDPKYL